MPSAPPPVVPPSSDPSSSSRGEGSQGWSRQSSTGKDSRRKKGASESADLLIATRIAESCNALWWGELIRHSLRLVLGIVVAIGIWVLLDHWVLSRPSLSGINSSARISSLVGLIVAVAAYVFFRIAPLIGHSISPEYAARSLERSYPNLRQSLTSYITLKDDPSQAGLQGRVVQSIGTSTAGYLKQHDELPEEATGNMKLWVSTAAALAMLVFYAAASPKNSLQSVRRLITPTASIAPVTRVSISSVIPGDAEAIACRTIQVTAEIRGLRGDEQAVCEVQYPANSKQVNLRKDETVGANGFSAQIMLDHSATGDLPYRIIAGDAASPTYRFLVKDVPVVALDSVNYLPPAYTGTGRFTRSTGAISAIEGTTITLKAETNRPIARAAIEFNPKPVGDTIQATDGAVEMTVGEGGRALSVNFALQIDERRSASVRRDSYRIRVWDDSGVSNPDPIIYPIDIIADLPPEVAIMLPTRVPKDVPIGTQQIIEVHASDADFGLTEIRLQMKSGIRKIGEPVLWKDLTGKRGNQVAEYRFRPSELGVSVGDTVRIVAIATDNKTSQASDQAKGNTSETDPIELTIVAADQMPTSEDAAGEGLSETDDQPASDPESSEEGSSNGSGEDTGEGEQKQGGGGAEGEQGSGQSGESGEQGSGGGKGDQPEQNDGENNDGENGGEGGQPGGEGQKDGENQSDQSSKGEQGQGESEPSSDDPSSGEPSSDEPGEGEPGDGEPMQGEPSPSEASQGEASQGEASQGEAGEGEQPEGSESSAGSNSKNGSGQSGQQKQSSQQNGGQSNPEQSGSSGGDDTSSQSDDQSAPKHDGEAFERIQEYLDQKQQEQSEQGGGQKGEPSESGEPSKGQSTDGQPSPENASQEDASQRDPSSNQPSGDESNGGSQGQGSESQGSESQGSESQGSESQGSESQGSRSQGNKGEQGQDSESSQGDQGSEDMSETGSSESSQGDQSSGQKGEEQQGGSEQESGEQTPEQQGAGEKASGKQGDASDQGSESAASESEQASSDQAKGEPKEGQPGSESEAGNSDQAGSPAEDDSSTQARSPNPSSQGRPGSGDGSGEGDASDSPLKPSQSQAANDDYARKATDMVLDYLDQTRDEPDQELLDRLNWTQQDLQKFQDRWKDINDLEGVKNGNDPAANRATEEALRSLGLRPPSTGQNLSNGEQADSLQGIRDSGNRRRPPAALRDAFDAFRRQMGNGK